MVEQKRFIFGEFELDTVRRRLLKSGEQVALSSRAYDLLTVLVGSRGSVLTKNELLDKVWPDQFVEENNLSVQISALRKALGDNKDVSNFIVTVPGTGYGFVADVTEASDENELVIESHSYSTVIVEEHIEETSWPNVGNSVTRYADSSIDRRKPVRRSFRLAVPVTAAVIIGIVAGGYAFRAQLFGGSPTGSFVKHNVRQLTTSGKVGRAALSPDGKMFVYTIDDLGAKSLWLGYVAGGNHLQLLEPSQTVFRDLAFSSNSETIYFSTFEGRNNESTLYKMPISGGPQTKVMDGVGRFSFSADGEKIAFKKRDPGRGVEEILVARLDGSEPEIVLSVPMDGWFIPGTISWSPDGKSLAYSRVVSLTNAGFELGIIDLAQKQTRMISVPGLSEIATTAWSREGSRLIVTARERNEQSSVPQYHLWNISLPNGELTRITSDRSNYGASWHNDAGESLSISANGELLLAVEHRQVANVWVAPVDDAAAAVQITDGSFGKYDGLWGLDWTPDGKLIYTTSDTRSQFIARMNADGTEHRPLTAAGNIDSVLTVTNDGRYVIFHSNRGGEGQFDIWRMDIDGSNIKQLTFGGKAFQPRPSVDGAWVYYISALTGSRVLCRVPMDGGESETIYEEDVVWPNVSPDGSLLAAVDGKGGRSTLIFSIATGEIMHRFENPATGTHFMGSRWTPDGRSIVFRDRNSGYWIQSLDGKSPELMGGMPNERLYNFAFSRDGKQFAFVRGREIRDVVLLESSNEK